ncbi:MAG: NifB/NifX family molybdenum-iron cluster-binding protein [Candidatus Glassbacteria bacterium]
MKIAVASKDGISIAEHFGRSAHFIVYQIEKGAVADSEIRSLASIQPGRDDCTGKSSNGVQHEGDYGHSAFIDLLKDCDIVISHGMGRRAAVELKNSGIEPCTIREILSPGEAVAGYLAGSLKSADEFCRCHDN